jgi:hypothetical protein
VDPNRKVLRIWHVDANLDDQVFFSMAVSKTCPDCALQEVAHPLEPLRKLDVVPSEDKPHVIVTDCSFQNQDGPASKSCEAGSPRFRSSRCQFELTRTRSIVVTRQE